MDLPVELLGLLAQRELFERGVHLADGGAVEPLPVMDAGEAQLGPLVVRIGLQDLAVPLGGLLQIPFPRGDVSHPHRRGNRLGLGGDQLLVDGSGLGVLPVPRQDLGEAQLQPGVCRLGPKQGAVRPRGLPVTAGPGINLGQLALGFGVARLHLQELPVGRDRLVEPVLPREDQRQPLEAEGVPGGLGDDLLVEIDRLRVAVVSKRLLRPGLEISLGAERRRKEKEEQGRQDGGGQTSNSHRQTPECPSTPFGESRSCPSTPGGSAAPPNRPSGRRGSRSARDAP